MSDDRQLLIFNLGGDDEGDDETGPSYTDQELADALAACHRRQDETGHFFDLDDIAAALVPDLPTPYRRYPTIGERTPE